MKNQITKPVQRTTQDYHEMLRRVHAEIEKNKPKNFIEVRYVQGRQILKTRQVHVDIKF